MKLWLDDVRPAPDGWVHAKTGEEAIDILKQGQVTQMSFDHDLGIGRINGYEVAKWVEAMAVTGQLPQIKRLSVHSANPVGRDRIVQALRKARDAWEADNDRQ
jgi:hypothetical protein